MQKSTKILLIIAVPLILLLAFVVPKYWSTSNDSFEVQAQQQPAQPDNRLAVRAHVVETSEFSNQIFATGTVRADEEIIIRPETSGRITALHVEEGRPVKKDELLVKINDSELQAQLRRAQYRENLAKIREERTKNLIERNAIAQEEYDIALNELNVVKAEIDLIKAQIEKTEIRAPFDGVIGLKFVSEGAYVTSNTTIASFQSIENVKVDFSVPERYVALVNPGQAFTFLVQGSDRRYNGNIYAIEPRIDTDTRTLALRGLADNPNNRILPGSFVEVQFNLESIPQAMMVPSEAIIPVMGGQSVYLYKDGNVASVPVQIGVRTDTRVHVTEGLAPGDTLITTGILQLRSGMPVRIAEFR